MLLNKIEEPFNDKRYITELKLDGIRVILTKENGVISLFTSDGNNITSIFEELTKIEIPDGTILDGELVSPDNHGKPDYKAIIERLNSTQNLHQKPITFVVFDILKHYGRELHASTLIERKMILEHALPIDNELITKIQYTIGHAEEYFDIIIDRGLEGIVMKDKLSKYIYGETNQWFEIRNPSYITPIRLID